MIMGLRLDLWVVLFIFNGILDVILCDQQGFLSLSCGGNTTYVDSLNITWISDDEYINVGRTLTTSYVDNTSSMNTSVRYFPDARARNCYKLPVQNISSSVLVRAKFVYQNYDKLKRAPVFNLSLGRAMTAAINLSKADPWIGEFIWPVFKDYVPFCLYHIPNGGNPVISSLELRPLPQGAYNSGLVGPRKNFLRKCYRINCGYTNGSIRYPLDRYDRVWDADVDFSPSHLTPNCT